MSNTPDIQALFEAGAHFGHKTSRWCPKMAPYIHSKRQQAHIINLEKTVENLNVAMHALEKIAASGKPVLFVSTKKQLKDLIRTAAESVSMPYVTNRWVGGTLTNSETVTKQIKKLKNLSRRMSNGGLEKRYSKLEVQRFQEEIDLLNTRYGGIKEMIVAPAAIFVADAIQDKNAIKEANLLGIPVFAIADTNVDPTDIDYVIPANDDAIKAVQLITDYLVSTIKAGQAKLATQETTNA